jgi:hypothetical protein
MKKPTIVFALALIASGVPANAGAVLLCNEFGCRSSPYIPPVPVPVGPPAIYSAPPHGGPTVAYGVPLARSPIIPPPTSWPRLRLPDFPPEAYRAPPPPPPRSASADPEGKAIERDILEFCDRHPDEPFCGKLGAFLRKHPEARPRD